MLQRVLATQMNLFCNVIPAVGKTELYKLHIFVFSGKSFKKRQLLMLLLSNNE